MNCDLLWWHSLWWFLASEYVMLYTVFTLSVPVEQVFFIGQPPPHNAALPTVVLRIPLPPGTHVPERFSEYTFRHVGPLSSAARGCEIIWPPRLPAGPQGCFITRPREFSIKFWCGACGSGEEIFLQSILTDCGAHPASYLVATRGSFPGGKVADIWRWPLT